MSIDSAVQESEVVANWLESKIDGLDVANPERCRIAAAEFNFIVVGGMWPYKALQPMLDPSPIALPRQDRRLKHG